MLPWHSLQEIVVFRTDHIGDLIVSTPFLGGLRQAAPQARITAVVPKGARGVLEGNPDVDQILTLPEWPAPFRPDLAISLSPRTATFKLVYASKARYRAGYFYPERLLTRLACRFWLTHGLAMPIRRCLDRGQPVPHEIEQQGQLADFLGFPVNEKSPRLPVSPEDLAWGLEQTRGRVAIHLSVNWFSHGWTAEDFIELCSHIPDAIVTYGPDEALIVASIRQSPRWKHPLLGDLSLKRWAAVLAGARAVVSTDTGAVHVAAAHGRPLVVVYKPEQFELCRQQWYPWGVAYRALIKSTSSETRAQVARALEELQE